jgi:transcriptional regulator with XRE-family HTH domain
VVGITNDAFSPEATGTRLREHRRAGRWSQAALAREMTSRGFTWHQNTVFRIEGGRRRMTLEEAAELTAILGVSFTDLGCAA